MNTQAILQQRSQPLHTATTITPLTISSTAPFYSVAVTAPLITALVGLWAPVIYLIAAVPAVLVARAMAANDVVVPDKGTVYSWARKTFGARIGVFAGIMLAATGIIATSGMAAAATSYLQLGAGAGEVEPSSSLLTPGAVAATTGAIILIVVTSRISSHSVRITSWLQWVAIVVQGAGIVATGWVTVTQWLNEGLTVEAHLETGAVIHAVLLAVFAYWGFDTAFALSEESETSTAPRAVRATVVTMVVFFMALSAVLATSAAPTVLSNPVVLAAIIAASVASLGSTVLPTVRGLQAMAEDTVLPHWLQSDTAIWRTVVTAASAWCAISILVPGVFWDSVDALSVAVGAYFVIASLSAARLETSARTLHLISAALMAAITASTWFQSFAPDYGVTVIELAGMQIGGVGVLATVILVGGALVALSTRHKPETHAPTFSAHTAREAC